MIIEPEEFDFTWFESLQKEKRNRGNQGGTRKKDYKGIVTAFDIETTRIKAIEQSVMYVWQWQFDEEYTVIGRTWEQFEEFAQNLKTCMKEREHLVVFVHNLSYEFQFLRGIYNFQSDEVFALKKRKVLKCDMYGFLEFRCSYIHSNMSLAEYTHKMGATHTKLSGEEFDYSIERYPWTPLTPREIEYATNDVLGLVESIKIEMAHDEDNLYTFPLTSTGYVRRDAKRAMKQVSHYYVSSMLPDKDTYVMLREAFRGGNTHASRFYSNMILDNVRSFDRSSSYPDVLCNCQFPISKFFHVGECTVEKLMDLINRRKKAVLMRIGIVHPTIKPGQGCPYISKDKSRNIKGGKYDNGRVLEAEYLETTITDIDLKIILLEYDFEDLIPLDVYHARYGYLPQPLVNLNISYYQSKTKLKDVEGEEIFYMKSKNKLNSIYGMMAQDPVKQEIDFLAMEGFIIREDDIGQLLESSNKRAFLAYQWGVWTTAHARWRLEEGIQIAGDYYVYSDTDSVKYIDNPEVTERWEEYNKARIADSEQSGAYAIDPKGNTHYMGVYEDEGLYQQFITMGAKKYAYVKKGKLTVTIAGVNKSKGGEEMADIRNFVEGFIFVKAGGTEAVYNDYPEIHSYEVDGHTIPITANVVLRDSTYTLGITEDYKRLLLESRIA
ncbi:hypothetical protein AAGT75_004719 [Escherichia coli]